MGVIHRDLAGRRVRISTHGTATWQEPNGEWVSTLLEPLIGPPNMEWCWEYSFPKLESPHNLRKIERFVSGVRSGVSDQKSGGDDRIRTDA